MTARTSRLSRIGPFFALGEATEDRPWRPLRALEDAATLDERVRHTQNVLGERAGTEIAPRVAASTMSLGLFSRLLAPQLGALALGVRLPALDLDTTLWSPTAGGPWPLALTGPVVSPDLEAGLQHVVFPLAELIGTHYALSAQVLRGNIASSLFGALSMIRAARPDLAGATMDIGHQLLSGPLAGTGTLADDHPTPTFVRNSCCLFYRVPGGGYCGECVLRHR